MRKIRKVCREGGFFVFSPSSFAKTRGDDEKR
jgi:hypothetical protein